MHSTIARRYGPRRSSVVGFAMTIPVCWILVAAGSASAISSTTLATLKERQFGSTFGYSVASGDVNGDGKADVIVGAYYDNTAAHYAGAVYVYYGGASPDSTPDLTILGEGTDDYFGFQVAAGDVNGDGKADVIASATGYGSAGGEIRVYFGGSGINPSQPDWGIEGTDGEGLGYTLAYAGDVNGDHYGDIIAGKASTAGAYVFFGNSAGTDTLDVSGEVFTSVAGAGDVNKDGYDDVVLGGAYNAYLFYGGSSPDGASDVTFTQSGSYGQVYVSVAGADVNGDGYSDVIVGANFADRAYVYFGADSDSMNTTADRTYAGESNNDQFGYAVWSAGDVNADGYADIIVGAPYSDAGGSESGKMYFFFGGPNGGPHSDVTADLTLTGTEAEHLGFSVASGDFNGDGHSDLVTGMYGAGSDPPTGYVHVQSLTLPSTSNSFYVPQSGPVGSPSEGPSAIAHFYTCPNNDALPDSARIELVIKDSNGYAITNIDPSDINIRFNGGTPGPSPGQGFSGSGADSVIANSHYNPLANCPDVRRIPADAASDASGVAYLTFKGASSNNPGVAVRDASRKWGHYDTEIPVYVLGVKLQGRLTSNSFNDSYKLEIKNVDVSSGLTTAANSGELLNSLDYSPLQSHIGKPDSENAINWWVDFNSDGSVDSTDYYIQQAHAGHKCNNPNNP